MDADSLNILAAILAVPGALWYIRRRDRKDAEARRLREWLESPEGQRATKRPGS